MPRRKPSSPATAEDSSPVHEPSRPAAPIAFIPNPLFEHPDADNIILRGSSRPKRCARGTASVAAGSNAKAADVYMARVPQNLPPFLQDIFRQPVMPQELETDAFRRMNFLDPRAPPAPAARAAPKPRPSTGSSDDARRWMDFPNRPTHPRPPPKSKSKIRNRK